jgi:hypothetical protein
MLQMTFKLWPSNVCEFINNSDKDTAFLKSIDNNRAAAFDSLDKISRCNKMLEAEGKRVRREYDNQNLQCTSMGDPSWPSTSQDDTSSTADKGDTSYDECTTPCPPTASKKHCVSFNTPYLATHSTLTYFDQNLMIILMRQTIFSNNSKRRRSAVLSKQNILFNMTTRNLYNSPFFTLVKNQQ